MNSSTFRLSLILFLLFQIQQLQAQIDKGKLTKGSVVTSEISPGEVHHYTLNLGTDYFAYVKLMQQGVDLRATTYDPTGKKLGGFDSQNGKNGPELITLVAIEKGEYVIEVRPYDEKEPQGKYELRVEKIKPRAVTPSDKVDELFTMYDRIEAPGAAVAVVKDGKIIYKKGYGGANLEYDIPISPSTVFHIASISKQFTVFSILLLEKEGKLSLDDDIRKYIPEVPNFGKTITLKHLASHTSGLRDQWVLLSMAGWRMDDVITKEHILKLVSRQKDLNFEPGAEYAYCNTGFTLLAEVVARVSEMSFAEFTEANIFKPLQMSNTLFYDDHEKVVKNRAYSYQLHHTGYKKSVLNYANVGATSLFTTVEDMSLWALNFESPTIGDVDIFKQMNTPAVLNNGKTFGGALGQFVSNHKGMKHIEHGGADAGYRTFFARFPDQDFAVVVFGNDAAFNPNRMAYNIVDIYLEDQLEVEKKEEVKKEKSDKKEIEISPKILASYVGNYELQPGFIISITEDKGNLFVQATRQPISPLIPLSTTEFNIGEEPVKIAFVANDEGKVDLLQLHQGGQIMDAPRAVPFDLATVDLSDFTGKFYSEELETTYTFKLVDGKLIALHSRISDFELNPAKEDTFTGSAWFFGQIAFQRDEKGAIIGCNVSAGRVKNLRFQKVK